MTLNPKVQVPVPAKGVVVRRSGAYPAVYKVLRSYRNGKGQPTNDRVNIGKLDLTTNKLIPNARYWEYYGTSQQNPNFPQAGGASQENPAILPASDSIRSFGAEFLFGRVMASLGLGEILNECLGAPEPIQTVALYMAARGNDLEGFPDYRQGFTLSPEPLGPSAALGPFASVTPGKRMSFFGKWAERNPPGKCLAYHVPVFSRCPKDVIDGEWGRGGDGDRPPRFGLGCFFSQNSGLPAFYLTYPATIVGKLPPRDILAHNPGLGVSGAPIVLGPSLCSTPNVKSLAAENHAFILGVPPRGETARAAIEPVRAGILSRRNRIAPGLYAVSHKGRFHGTACTMNIYHSPELAALEREDLFRSIESLEQTLSRLRESPGRGPKRYGAFPSVSLDGDGSPIFKRDLGKMEEAVKDAGFSCLLTNSDLGLAGVLDAYRRKALIEKSFSDVMYRIDTAEMTDFGPPHGDTTEGKLFCSFISLTVVSEIGNKLADLMKKRDWGINNVMTEMERIRLVKAPGGKTLMTPLTETQREILKAFKLGEEDVKDYAAKKAP
ncbi:MAG: hypothetical protein LBF58_06635 [Deltaproteobacteria bacterium]|jgi:hypothetical protein|nr:hypothetical protein [Deltaproteobacteria bacterium]